MALDIHQVLGIAAKSYLNGEALVEDARLLFANERWPRVIFLCCIAEEELAKSILSIAAAVRIRIGMFDDASEKYYRKRLRTHKMKTTILVSVVDLLSSLPHRGELVQFAHSGDSRTEDIEIVKMGALYADFDGNGVRGPSDLHDRSGVEDVLASTARLFDVARANFVPLFEVIETCDLTVCREWMRVLDGVV